MPRHHRVRAGGAAADPRGLTGAYAVAVPDPASVHRAGTRVMSALLVLLGVVLVVSTVARGGGPFTIGVLFGLLLAGAGVARLWLERARERE